MLTKYIIIVVVVSAVKCMNFSPCGNDQPVPIQVDLNDCIDQPCLFKSGEPLDSNITFDAPYEIERMESTLSVSVPIIGEVDYEIPRNTCEHLIRGWCPLEEGERATYKFQMQLPVLPQGLSVRITVRITAFLKDNKKDLIACFKFNGKTIK